MIGNLLDDVPDFELEWLVIFNTGLSIEVCDRIEMNLPLKITDHDNSNY